MDQARLGHRILLVPIFINFLSAILLISLCFLNFIIHTRRLFTTHFFVPITNILFNGVLAIGVVTIGACCDRLQQRRRVCCCLMNGKTAQCRTALPFLHSTMIGSFSPYVTGVTILNVISFPKAVVNRVLNKIIPRITVGCRLVVDIVAIITSVLSLIVALFLSIHHAFSSLKYLGGVFGRSGSWGG